MSWWKWILGRFFVPLALAAAGPMLHRFLPGSEVVNGLPLMAPFVVFLMLMVVSRLQSPSPFSTRHAKEFDAALRSWRALDLSSRLLAAFFECAVATQFYLNEASVGRLLLISLFFYGPYVGISLLARSCLLHCYELIAEGVVEEQGLLEPP